MHLSPVDRMSAIMLAQTIHNTYAMLDMKGDLPDYLRRLNSYGIFTVPELTAMSRLEEDKVRKILKGSPTVPARTYFSPSHLDHAVNMVASRSFAQKHVKSVAATGTDPVAIARVVGYPSASVRRWIKEG